VRPGSRCLLFVSPKRRHQEKGDREAAALRVPKSRSQSGKGRKLATLKQCGLLIPCLTPTFGSCFNAEQVNCNGNRNGSRNRNRNRNRNP
jgi:hypothetical protein